jgi:hypothetical protein
LGEEDRRADVDRDDRVERRVVERRGRVGGEDAGVVDENVDASAEDLGGVVGELPDRAGGGGDVGTDEVGSPAGVSDLGDGRMAAVGVAAGDRDVRPVGGKRGPSGQGRSLMSKSLARKRRFSSLSEASLVSTVPDGQARACILGVCVGSRLGGDLVLKQGADR